MREKEIGIEEKQRHPGSGQLNERTRSSVITALFIYTGGSVRSCKDIHIRSPLLKINLSPVRYRPDTSRSCYVTYSLCMYIYKVEKGVGCLSADDNGRTLAQPSVILFNGWHFRFLNTYVYTGYSIAL